MNTVLILNDVRQAAKSVGAIETALNEKFTGTGECFKVLQPELIDLSKTTPDDVAHGVRIRNPEPVLALVDGSMKKGEDDGLRVVDALRKCGFRGFTYLWSAANPRSQLESQPILFQHPGAGGFPISDCLGLSEAVWKSWRSLESFEIKNPELRVAIDPIEPIIRLLSELQALTYEASVGGLTKTVWKQKCEHSTRHFDQTAVNVVSAIRVFNPDIDFSEANELLDSFSRAPIDNAEEIAKRLQKVRDCLLNIAGVSSQMGHPQ